MFKDTIRNFFIFIISIYTFYKLLNIRTLNKTLQIFLFLFSIIISSINAFLFGTNQSLNWLLMLLSLFLLLRYTTKISVSTLYVTVLFSFALSFISFFISGIFISFVLFPIYYNEYEIPWYLIRILVGFIQFFFIYCCFKVPRLQKGMNSLYHIPSGNIGSTFCIILIILIIMFTQAKTAAESFMLIFNSIIFILGFALIYWWNYHLTQTYKKYLKKNEIDSLNLLLEERNQQITYLRNENDKLSRIIHKDNKLIPALSMAIIDSREHKTKLNLPEPDTDSDLLMKLKQLYDERVEILANYQQEIMNLPATNFSSINAILTYTQTQALKADIQYQVILFDNLSSTIPNEISEDDFAHILSDLLANAINACQNTPSAAIQIYLGKIDNISTIKIYNTGRIFNMDTLKNLGLTRHTTHADTGGSGIGLMDIWMIKERYAATLLIDEVTDSFSVQPYTCINILFNHKNHYIVQSDRHKELSTYINRPDIMIISKE